MSETPQEFFDGLPARFKPERAAGLEAVFQFDVSGDGGGTWHVTVADGACTVAEGPADAPGVTVAVSAEDWARIVSGSLNPQMAFLTGKLRVDGDMGLAMRLQALFF